MDVPDHKTIRHFLAKLGVTPDGPTAGEYDRLQRQIGVWWAGGGSLTSFVAHHQAARAEARSMDPEPSWRDATTFEQRMQVLRDRYAPPS